MKGFDFILDFRFNTFLTLCHLLSYTKTAAALNLTQPAVTQHIKYLEQAYDIKLFIYEGKTLKLSEEGLKLYEFASSLKASCNKFESILVAKNKSEILNFGTTLTIGEFIMPKILKKLYMDFPQLHISMLVDNTKNLIALLENGDLDFILIEGHFKRDNFDSQLFSKENFIGICSPFNSILNEEPYLKDLLNENLILREKGSGSRDIFEQILIENNLSMESFEKKMEIGNINLIKDLVREMFMIS